MLKRCTRCNAEKDLSEFYVMKNFRGKGYDYAYTVCKPCSLQRRQEYGRSTEGKERMIKYRAKPNARAGRLLQEARKRSVERNLEFNLTVGWISNILAEGKCQVTGIPFDMDRTDVRSPARAFGPSLDRINPDGGYTTDNVQVVAWIYNRAKGVQGHAEVMTMVDALCQLR